MYHLSLLEESYKKYMGDLQKWAPEGVIMIDLPLLEELGLMTDVALNKPDPALTHQFHAIESSDKLTLVNDQFVIWITSERARENDIITLTLIAINSEKGPELEVVFAATGAYNSSKLILRVLEKFLSEIKENEDYLNRIEE